MKTGNQSPVSHQGADLKMYDRVRLVRDFASDLPKGAKGMVVECYGNPPEAFFVEFPEIHIMDRLPATVLALDEPASLKRKREPETVNFTDIEQEPLAADIIFVQAKSGKF
jgi:hypothetical protein